MDTDSFLQLFSEVTITPPGPAVIVAGLLALVLIGLSGFASGSEIAFFSLTPSDLDKLDTEHNAKDKKIEELRDDSERTLAAILLTNTLVNVTIVMLLNYFFGHIFNFGNAYWLQFICLTVILTFILLLFGEIIPKMYARSHALQFCRGAVAGVMLTRKLFWPLESILMHSGALAEKAVPKENRQLSVDDLEQALDLTDKEDIKDEQSMLRGIIRFGDETAKEVMTSRQDIVAIDITSSFKEVLQCVVDNNYSRIPVYQDNDDNIRGILYIKDLLPHLRKGNSFRWQSLIRAAYFVPETKKIDDLLREFQANKVHIAIVVDEFGGTSGIVTMEDILEEIVGEINDEYDEEEHNYVRLNSNTYLFEGKTLLSDFCKVLGVDDAEFDDCAGDADTVAGLLLELKGDFLQLHEVVDYKNYTFEVMAIEERRISKVKVTVHQKRD